jgi:hypothetical protein
MVRTSWSMKEFQQALRMKRRGATCTEIGVALGRSPAAVEAKFKYCGKVPVTISMHAIAGRADERLEEQIKRNAAHDRDLTGVICGDPPTGYLLPIRMVGTSITICSDEDARRRALRTLCRDLGSY